jgi:DNA repair exonuclease SbcCD ATPase subunit
MKTLNLALSALLAAGLSAALPSTSHAQARGGYPGYGGNAQGSALAEQRKQLAEANAEVARLQKELAKIKAKLQAKYESKEEWETAKTNLKNAENAYESARKKAVAKLYASPDYKAAKEKQLKSEQTLQELQGNPKADPKALDKAQQDRLTSGITVRNLESSALSGDPAVSEAKTKLADAKKAWEALQDELKEALKQDPEYTATEDQVTQAQANADQMKASLAQAAAAEREARRSQIESSRGSSGRSSPRSSGSRGYGGAR